MAAPSNERAVVERMTERGLRLATAESTVGGLIGHLLTNVAGSSKVFVGGITAYHGAPKIELLHVDRDVVRDQGSVAEDTVRQMAEGAREAFDVDLAVAESGMAAPRDPSQPARGVYYIGVVADGHDRVARYEFDGDRESTKQQAAQQALQLVLDYLDATDGEGAR
ncbi:MAG: CinA family protein [Dehalococcoidia bacterium]